MMSIYLLFHFGQFTNFKHFYLQYVCKHLNDLFPDLVSYERITARQERVLLPLMLYLKYRGLGKSRGINYIDSTLLRVCHIKREKQNKVFMGVAEKGKSTMGWFFGFKLHLIINDKGELLSFYLTKGNGLATKSLKFCVRVKVTTPCVVNGNYWNDKNAIKTKGSQY